MPLPPNFRDHVHQALKLWNKDASHGSPIGYLALVQQAQRQDSSIRQATNHVLRRGLEAMQSQYADLASLLSLRFIDAEKARVIANQRNLAEVTIFRLQSQALEVLAETLAALERDSLAVYRVDQEKRLECDDFVALMGVEPHLARLIDVLATPATPWLVSLEGIGGIGKTALACAVLRRTIDEGWFAGIGWVSARQRHIDLAGDLHAIVRPALTGEALVEALMLQLLPELPAAASLEAGLAALRNHLDTRSHLIVIDNLETVLDVEHLLPALRRLASPSKFLLTSRQSLFAEPDIFHFPVPELSEPHSLQLVRQEARLRNLPDLLTASDAELRPIYETVGGNPLALRLVVGQAHAHGLAAILDDLSAARGRTAENLYTYIYQHVWQSLDELSRLALLAMPLAAERGGRLEYLAEVSGLQPGDLRHALDRLVSLNLVDSRGGLHERRYSIHNLTRSFLLQQVIRWQ